MKLIPLGRLAVKCSFVLILFCLFTLGPGSAATTGASPANTNAGEDGSPVPQNAASDNLHVLGRSLLSANDVNLIMRGVNHMHTWFPDQTSSLKNIKDKRANAVRVVLSTGDVPGWTRNSAGDVAHVIQLCKTNRLICVLEVHDTTGYGESSEAISLAQAVDYWKAIKSVLVGQEPYIIINLGNEPYGNTDHTLDWVDETKNALQAMRNAGFQHMLMVDAPNWGQDWEFVMRDNAASIFSSDPLRNTVFSIHMYGVFETKAAIESYLLHFVNAELPLVIGEFGHFHTDGNPNEDAIMSLAERYGIGYLGWAWSGNCCGGEYLDMVVNFNPGRLTWWGSRIFGGENGICPTSKEASIYGGSPDVSVCSLTLSAAGLHDGWILESTETSGLGGSLNSSATTFNLGDDATNRQYRGILHFNTSSLPNNAVINKVRLRVKLQSILGTNPFTTHGGLKVDIRKPFFGAAPALAVHDFQAAANRAAVGTIGSAPVNGWNVAVLSAAAFPYVNLTGATQLRLRFGIDDNNDLGADLLRFYSGNATAANRPVLIVEYTVP